MKLIQASFAKRALIVGLVAGSGLLAASSFATTAAGPAAKERCEARHAQKDPAKWAERRASHLSALKDKLKLSAEQEAAWNAFADASQPGMRAGVDRQALRAEFEKLSTPERLDKMLAMSEARRARMAERAEAAKAFYAQLSAEQQAVFDAEAKFDRPRGQRHHRHHS